MARLSAAWRLHHRYRGSRDFESCVRSHQRAVDCCQDHVDEDTQPLGYSHRVEPGQSQGNEAVFRCLVQGKAHGRCQRSREACWSDVLGCWGLPLETFLRYCVVGTYTRRNREKRLGQLYFVMIWLRVLIYGLLPTLQRILPTQRWTDLTSSFASKWSAVREDASPSG